MATSTRASLSSVGVIRGEGPRIEAADDAFLAMVGYTRAELEAGEMNWAAMTPPEHLHLDEAGIRQASAAASGGFTAPYQKEFIRKDGTRVSVLLVCAFIPDTAGKWLGYVVDLSTGAPRPAAPRDGDVPLDEPLSGEFYGRLVSELARERARMAAMLDGTDALVWTVDLEGRLLAANKAFQAAQRQSSGRDMAIGESLLGPEFPHELVELWRELYARAARGERFSTRTRHELPGRIRYYDDVLAPVRDDDKNIVGVVVVAHDVTARVKLDEELRESEARFRSLCTSAPLGIYLTDPSARPLYVNPRLAALWEASEDDLVGSDLWLRRIHPEDAPRIAAESAARRAEGREFTTECRVTLPRRGERHVRIRVAPVRDGDRITAWVGSVEDETERHELANRAHQRDKMESLGTLAGGIAHDFNNMLGIILGYAEVALGEPDAPDLGELLLEIQIAAQRARDLVRQILAFSRQAEPTSELVDLGFLVVQGVRLLHATLPSEVTIDLIVPPEKIMVQGDAAALQQIVVNLCTNAAHAMHGRPGTITIELRTVGAPPSGEARLSIADTGSGMREDVRARVFDPFFTTKPVGEGTGMGLAVVHGVVTAHGGTIEVESTPGAGSTFRVGLPLVAGSSATIAPRRALSTSPRSGRVLFVEDEAALTKLAMQVLARAGYEATAAGDGLEALRIFSADPDQFDVVVSDLAMPGLSGDKLARAIHVVRPGLPFVLVSGFLGSLDDPEADALGVDSVLGKPLTNAELVGAVRGALERAS